MEHIYELDLLTLICLKEVEKMSEAFEKHMDKRISEMRERIRNYRSKRNVETRTFGERVEKAWKNIDQIKSN